MKVKEYAKAKYRLEDLSMKALVKKGDKISDKQYYCFLVHMCHIQYTVDGD